MSQTIAVLTWKVRQHMNDYDPDDYAVPSHKVWRALVKKASEWAPRVGYGEAWSTSVLTLSDTGSSDFQMAATLFDNVSLLRLASNGQIIQRWGRQVMEANREGNPTATGVPYAYFFLENTAQRRTVRLFPRPVAADTVDALTSAVPADSAQTTDNINFADTLCDGLAACVASQFMQSMSEDDMAKRKLTPELAARLYADGEAMKENERMRQWRMKRSGEIAVAWRG